MRPKFLDAAPRDAARIAELERIAQITRDDAETDSLWVREQGKSFALGFISCVLLELMLFLIWMGTR